MRTLASKFERITFSRNEAAMLVGGLKRLKELIADGRVRADKGTSAQNSRWRCNGMDIINNMV